MIFTLIKQEKKYLFLLLGLAFLIRAFIFQFYLSKDSRYWQIDSPMYHEIGVSLSRNKGISWQNGTSNFYRLPGYSLFLAPFYKICGANYSSETPDSKGVFLALWIQILLASLIPILIFLLSMALFKNLLLAKVASMWSVFHIGLVLYSGFFMTESLFIFFLLLFLILLFPRVHLFFCPVKDADKYESMTGLAENRFMHAYIYNASPEIGLYGPSFYEMFKDVSYKQGPSRVGFLPAYELFLAGVFLGLAGLIRPVGHYLWIFTAIMIMFSKGVFKEKIQRLLTFSGGYFIPTVLWLVRNYALLGYLFFHTLPGGHFLYLSASRVAMHVQNVSYQEARVNLEKELNDIVRKKELTKGKKLNEIEYSNEALSLSVKYFKMKPLITIKNWLTDILRSSLSLYSSELLFLESGRKKIDYFKKGRTVWDMFRRYLFPDTRSKLLRLIIFYEITTYLFILLGMFLGMISLFTRDAFIWCSWLRSISFIGLLLVVALAGGYARMRLPAEPLIIILSFGYWMDLFKRKVLSIS